MGSTENVYLYAGEQRDFDLGLDYLRARWMNPAIGRFYGMDPFEGFQLQPMSLHRFLYVNGSPVNSIDPGGELGFSIHDRLLELQRVKIGLFRLLTRNSILRPLAALLVNHVIGEAVQWPIAKSLLLHYIAGSGQEFVIDPVPLAWQDRIVTRSSGVAGFYPQRDWAYKNPAIPDFKNSLGHFDLRVTPHGNGTNLYSISDIYDFGPVSTATQRHGFEMAAFSPTRRAQIENLVRRLENFEIKGPGGLSEKVTIENGVLLIPQPLLAIAGIPFSVRGSFVR